jgi:hypothetical protein
MLRVVERVCASGKQVVFAKRTHWFEFEKALHYAMTMLEQVANYWANALLSILDIFGCLF